MEQLKPSKRYPLRLSYKGVTVLFTKHAVERSKQRGIDPIKLLRSCEGLMVRMYKRKGMVARWKPIQRRLIVITVFNA